MGGRNSFPGMECADEGIRVFVSEEISGFVQFEQRTIQIVAGELVAGILKNLLEVVARVLKASLQCSRTDVKFACDLVNPGTLAGEFSLDSGADPLGESFLHLVTLQLFLKLRREHGQELGVTSDERQSGVRRAEDKSIPCGSEDDGAAEVAFEDPGVRRLACEFKAEWRDPGASTMARDTQHPGEA